MHILCKQRRMGLKWGFKGRVEHWGKRKVKPFNTFMGTRTIKVRALFHLSVNESYKGWHYSVKFTEKLFPLLVKIR